MMPMDRECTDRRTTAEAFARYLLDRDAEPPFSTVLILLDFPPGTRLRQEGPMPEAVHLAQQEAFCKSDT